MHDDSTVITMNDASHGMIGPVKRFILLLRHEDGGRSSRFASLYAQSDGETRHQAHEPPVHLLILPTLSLRVLSDVPSPRVGLPGRTMFSGPTRPLFA